MDKEIEELIKNGTVDQLIDQFMLSERRTFFGYIYGDDIKKHFTREQIVDVIKWFCG